jgi:hypothetical protein
MGSKCLIVSLHETQIVRRQNTSLSTYLLLNTFTIYVFAPKHVTVYILAPKHVTVYIFAPKHVAVYILASKHVTVYILAPTTLTSFDVSFHIFVISFKTTCEILFSKLQRSKKSVLTDTVSGIVSITCPFRCVPATTALLANRIIL